MFEPTSRYYALETTTLSYTDPDGVTRVVAYKRRRLIPSATGQTTLLEHTAVQGERLDNLTARYLGEPTQFWRVCDANLVLRPEELEEVGRRITIALPQL
jgi:hypothetical protein